MPHRSPSSLRVLQCLRLKGFADAPTVALATGAAPAAVHRELERARARGHAHRPGSGDLGWALTPEGRAENQRLLSAEVEAVGVRDRVHDAYRRFLDLNVEVRALCTDWQVRGDELNDHSDLVYDRQVVDHLVAVHQRAHPICADLSEQLERFAPYGERLRTSLQRVVDGDGAWFAQPLVDSYHTVWFELHEDLLTTLGVDRAAETARM